MKFKQFVGAAGFFFTHNNNKIFTLMFENEECANIAYHYIDELDPLCVTTCLDGNKNVSLYLHNDNDIVCGFMHGWTTQYVKGIEDVFTTTCFILLGYFDQNGVPCQSTHGAILATKYNFSKIEEFGLLNN